MLRVARERGQQLVADRVKTAEAAQRLNAERFEAAVAAGWQPPELELLGYHATRSRRSHVGRTVAGGVRPPTRRVDVVDRGDVIGEGLAST